MQPAATARLSHSPRRTARGPRLRNPALTRSHAELLPLTPSLRGSASTADASTLHLDNRGQVYASPSAQVLLESRLRHEREHTASAQRLESAATSLAASAVAASERRAAAIEQQLAEARARGEAANERAAAAEARATSSDAIRRRLEKELGAAQRTLATAGVLESDLSWRLGEAEVQAGWVQPLKRQLDEARAAHAAEVSQLRARLREADLRGARRELAASGAAGAARDDAALWRTAARRSAERGRSVAEHVKASRSLVDQTLQSFATTRSLADLHSGLSRALHDARNRLVIAEQDLALEAMEASQQTAQWGSY